MNATSRTKKVYHLRKTVTSALRKDKPQEQKPQREDNSQFNAEQLNNNTSSFTQNNNLFKKPTTEPIIEKSLTQQQSTTLKLVDGPQLSISTLSLSFEEKLDCIQTKEIKLKNIGSSAIYYQWKFKNQPKINSNSIKDIKPKFFCHYSKQSIKPGQEITFIFSFLSEIPGFFTEQCEIICEPALLTPIPLIRLQGKAYIDDEWKEERANFLRQLEQSIRQCHVQETVDDLIDQVKLPEPERPNVNDPTVAEEIFEKVNQNKKLYFNPYVHKWFNQLFQEVWRKQHSQDENLINDVYWDQSIETFTDFIKGCSKLDDVQKKCYLQRLEHYTHLSTFPLPNKSQLYPTIQQIISQAAYHLGGDYADAAKKQLDMWEVPFREAHDNDTEDDLKARKQEVEKAKAEWLKRTKKKKWTQEEDKQMIQDFKTKTQTKTTHQILTKFEGFQNQAEYTRIQKITQQDHFNPQNYFLFLSRMKTVNEYSLEGKKVFLKFNLKLKDNCEKQLHQLSEYLVKKEEEKKRLEEEKKNTDAKKKKPVIKKKGHKQEEEQKPLSFDFSSILDQENWNGFLQTFRLIQERSPYLILIGCTYRERIGRADPNLTVGFLLQHLKTIEPSVEFMTHNQLFNIKDNIENETISQGSIFLVQNLNFLPSQTLCCQQVEVINENGVQKHKKTKRNVIYPEIRNQLDQWVSAFDVIVDEDRFLTKSSGISSYSRLEVVLGKTWWNYVAYVQRAQNQTFILSGDFNPESYLLIKRLLKYVKLIYLTGTLGLKFRMADKQIKQLGNITLNDKQAALIKEILSQDEGKLFLPENFKFLTPQEGEKTKCIIKSLTTEASNTSEDIANSEFIDIADNIGAEISQISSEGHLFMIGKSHTIEYNEKLYGQNSTTQILKSIYKLQQEKKVRHSIEVNTPTGIDYNKELVFYLVGIDEKYVQNIELKQKKAKIIQSEQGQQEEVEQIEQPEEEEENEKKKIDLVADFKLSATQTILNLLSGKFDFGLKNVSKYPKLVVL